MSRPRARQTADVIELSSRRGSSDTELVVLGFDAIYDQYVDYVASIGHRLLGRPHEVPDLIQDVFVEVHRKLDALKEPEALRGWLATITTRKALRRLRKRSLYRFVGLDEGGDYGEIAHEGMTQEQRALLGEIFERLDAMPARWRVVWCLSHLEGKNNIEIAESCGCSRSTVKRDLASARALLREVFDDE